MPEGQRELRLCRSSAKKRGFFNEQVLLAPVRVYAMA